MKKVIISVLGQDRPGIIAAVSNFLFQQNCNIENVSQTILQSEFSGIFIVSIPNNLTTEDLQKYLREDIREMELHIHVKLLKSGIPLFSAEGTEAFILTTKGPDRKGLVANITRIIAKYGINVSNLQAVFKGGDDPNQNMMIYEVDIPKETDYLAFEAEIRQKAAELDLNISIQHRKIFEAINRI